MTGKRRWMRRACTGLLGVWAAFAVFGGAAPGPYPVLDLYDMQLVLRSWQALMLPQTETNWFDAGSMTLALPQGEESGAVADAMPLGPRRTVLFVSEDGPTHETVVRDATGVPVAAIPAETGYSPACSTGTRSRRARIP